MAQPIPRWPFVYSLRTSAYFLSVEKPFLDSTSFALVNPQRQVVRTNTVCQDLSTSWLGDATDEELLARFIKGFFGGRVMTVERFILGLGLWRWFPAHFNGKFAVQYLALS